MKISGGGRCNVTHAEFIPNELINHYPRGKKELQGPFHTFMTGDTMAWFEERGVPLNIEADGRIFPKSNSSQTIIDCFLAEAKAFRISILKNCPVQNIVKNGSQWQVLTNTETFVAERLVITTGSNPKIWKLLSNLGHSIVAAVPSLFTFTSADLLLKDLAGIAVPATVTVFGSSLEADGPLLITHKGLSGPAILKLSAWGARELHQKNYRFRLQINWLLDRSTTEILEELYSLKRAYAKQQVKTHAQFGLPKRLWHRFLNINKFPPTLSWADCSKKQLRQLATSMTAYYLDVQGKSTFKEEFTTAGGVALKEINFKTYESKVQPGLYLAGEVLNIDAVTGGFNFQNAWTGGYLVAQAIASDYAKQH